MASIIAVLPWAAFIATTLLLVKKIRGHYVYTEAMRRNNFSKLTRYRHQDPILGLDLFINFMRSVQRGDSFDAAQALFRKYGNTALFTDPESSSDTEHFLDAFEKALHGVGLRMFFGKFRFLLGRDRAATEACQEVHNIVDKLIQEALDTQKKPETDSRESYNLLRELAKVTERPLDLRYQVLNVFLPGYDSTAIGLSDIFFKLARHPRVWRKLRAEVLSTDRPFIFEVVRSMKYLKNVLNESFRLISPIGRNTRMCVRDCILPHGGGADGQAPVFVKGGTEVDMVFRALQRDVDVWGEDAATFRPERWEDPGLRPSSEYMPFSRGGRACPAQQMALFECGYILVRFLQEFERMENKDLQYSFVEQHRVTMQSRNGVKVALTPAVL